MKSLVFSQKNRKEMLRDPISYIFCLGFPIVMLILMTIVNKSIPKESNMEIFQIKSLAASIPVFGLTFIMLLNCLQVSKDRSTAFLIRLYISPMKPSEYIGGYTFPLILLSILQIMITFVVSIILGAIGGYHFSVKNVILCLICLLPTVLLFIGMGMLAGTVLNEKAASGACSIIISVTGILGGIWMDLENVKGSLGAISKMLPFYHGVRASRMAIMGNYKDIANPLIVVSVYAVIIYSIAVIAFRNKMQKDSK